MAAKRLHEDGNQSQDDDQAKRLKKQISFSSVIRKVINIKTLQDISLELEPLLRRVVKEEVEQGLVHVALALQRSPQLQRQIQVMEQSNLKLIFKKPPSLPIYTSTKIEGEDGQCLHIQLIDTRTRETPAAPCRLNLKVELVAINGDFPGDKEEWSPSEFNDNIEKERPGKKPLLFGREVPVTLRDGVASIGDLSFTDNSSWTRSRHFRIGARVVPGSYDGPRIIEALTARFTVKDQRGELSKKHYPPALSDEVWRLEKIGKGGTFYSKLVAENVETVEDFLKLLVIDPNHLRSILGLSMSDKMWAGIISHARTCPLGTKLYWFDQGPGCAIILNPICEVVSVLLEGNFCSPDQLHAQQRANVQFMAKQAYFNWPNLKEIDSLLPMEPALQGLIPSSSWHPANQEISASEFQVEGSVDESQLFEGFDAPFGSKTHPH